MIDGAPRDYLEWIVREGKIVNRGQPTMGLTARPALPACFAPQDEEAWLRDFSQDWSWSNGGRKYDDVECAAIAVGPPLLDALNPY